MPPVQINTTANPAFLENASDTQDGAMSKEDKAKLDSLGSGSINGTIDTNQVAFGTAPNVIGGSPNLTWDGGTQKLSINGQIVDTSNPTDALYEGGDTVLTSNGGTEFIPKLQPVNGGYLPEITPTAGLALDVDWTLGTYQSLNMAAIQPTTVNLPQTIGLTLVPPHGAILVLKVQTGGVDVHFNGVFWPNATPPVWSNTAADMLTLAYDQNMDMWYLLAIAQNEGPVT